MSVAQSCAPCREGRMVPIPQPAPTWLHASFVRLGAGPSRLEHVPPPAVDRSRMAGCAVSMFGRYRATQGGDLALCRWSAGPRALVRVAGIASLGCESRGRAQGQLVALDPRHVPPFEAVCMAEGILGVFGLPAMRTQSCR